MRHAKQAFKAGLVLALLVPAAGSGAKWMRIGTDVPVARLIANGNAYVKRHPRDAQGFYVLGRVHSLAFAQMEDKALVYYKEDLDRADRGGEKTKKNPAPDSLPQFPSYESMLVGRKQQRRLEAKAQTHLLKSIQNYQQATRLAPKTALYFLGLGWMLEQATDAQANGGPAPQSFSPTADSWRAQALSAYRQAFALSHAEDIARAHIMVGTDGPVSLEASQGILRLFKDQRLTLQQQSEQKQMQAAVKKLEAMPRAITPIIFPLRGQTALAQLQAPTRKVHFDLAGDGRGARWPWVTPDTGILVWDPAHTGRITSGRQLFGSATWWMFFQNGYQALAALDDNHDGWLTGRELDGIAVWRDRNANGVCEKGEVVSLRSLGIAAIAVQSAGQPGRALNNPRGLRLATGAFLPTYDWTPMSIK